MKINPKEFCHLSQSEVFLDWLYSISPVMHTKLVEHISKGLGCNANKQAMLNLLQAITNNSAWDQSLGAFLRKHFPAIIVEDDKDQLRNKHGVFDYYDPSLVTFPRRLIFLVSEVGDLQKSVLDFCAKQAHCDYAVVDDRVYIEYLPPELAAIKSEIPASNWHIKRYLAQHR